MVSRPLGNLTYSVWMSADSRSGGRADRDAVVTTNAKAPTTPTARPVVRLTALPTIAHPPDPIARVVAHQQRSIRQHQKPDRSPPARPVSQLPPRDEVLDRDRPAVLHVHPHDLRARGYRAIPRAVIRHERIAGVARGKPGACVEREPERRRVRLHRQRRRLDARAVGPGELRVGLVRKIALRPAVPLAVLENVEMLGRDVVAQVVA